LKSENEKCRDLNWAIISGAKSLSVNLLWFLLKFQVCVFAAGCLHPLRPPFEMEIFLGNQNMPHTHTHTHTHTADLSAPFLSFGCNGSDSGSPVCSYCMASDTWIRNTLH